MHIFLVCLLILTRIFLFSGFVANNIVEPVWIRHPSRSPDDAFFAVHCNLPFWFGLHLSLVSLSPLLARIVFILCSVPYLCLVSLLPSPLLCFHLISLSLLNYFSRPLSLSLLFSHSSVRFCIRRINSPVSLCSVFVRS